MCRCVMCANTDSNEGGRSEAVKIILDRNPAAFDSKFLSVSRLTVWPSTSMEQLHSSYYLHKFIDSVTYRPINLHIRVDVNAERVCA